ncbi:MAG: cation transporter [Nitrospirae bacterium]|nr:cation transporter [Nitrospirota bacterium]MBF0542644.1 cation transporter [Nitrospirota bacterium]
MTSLLKTANALALVTIFYNLLEGVVSVILGYNDDTIALFGFGLDSFVEVISGIGIWIMIKRITYNHNTTKSKFEQQALIITGCAFYVLSIGLTISAIINLINEKQPKSTLWGIIIALISIVCMWILIVEKTKVGKALNSDAILSDAACSKACMYLSLILLISSIGFKLTGIGGIDSIGAILIAVFSFKEGREAFQKSKGKSCSCGSTCSKSNN